MPVSRSSLNPSGGGRPLRQGQGRLLAPLLLLLLALFLGTARGVILRPFEEATGADVAFVVLAGANVPAARYVPLGRAIQKALVADGLRLWVGIPDEDMVSGVAAVQLYIDCWIIGSIESGTASINRSINSSMDQSTPATDGRARGGRRHLRDQA